MMKISACVIVRDEAANLPLWLDNMKEFADELIVVDTGSADNTVELATAAGATVYSFPWIDDFAAAKNYAIEQATGDWISFLDADEYFRLPDVRMVRQQVEHYARDPEIAGLIFQRINIDKATGQDMGTADYKPLLFRNVPRIRYVGSIHETLKNQPGHEQKRWQYVPDILVYHTGYSAAVMKQKAERNLRMLRDRQQKLGEQPLDNFHLMDCYYSLEDYEKAAYYAQRAIEDPYDPAGQEHRPYTVLVQSMMLDGADPVAIRTVFERATADYPEAAEYWMLWGIFDWRRRDYLAADVHLLHGLTQYQQNADNTAGYFLPAVCDCLGQIRHWQHRDNEAREYLWTGLQKQPRNAGLLLHWLQRIADNSAVDIISQLNKLYDKQGDGPFLVGVLAQTCQDEVYIYYARAAGIPLGEFDAYLRAGRIQAAAALLTEKLDTLYNWGGICLEQKSVMADMRQMLTVLLPAGYRSGNKNDQDPQSWRLACKQLHMAQYQKQKECDGVTR